LFSGLRREEAASLYRIWQVFDRGVELLQIIGPHDWELDALSPQVISDLIERELTEMIDEKKWAAAKRSEDRNRRKLELLEVPS
jgi:hypothetical protein